MITKQQLKELESINNWILQLIKMKVKVIDIGGVNETD
jgi:hypothetical protein